MQKNLSAFAGGAVFLGMMVGNVISQEMGKAGQPLWLRVVVSAVVAGCMAGGFVILVGRNSKK